MDSKKTSPFPYMFWVVIVFEFFERGAYYGVMSILSVYFTDVLKFQKTDVGLIKATIQPILYFLPIISGALADRFGYRRALLVAFTFLGTGYILASQVTTYSMIFIFLCIMALGAGTFKPIISGTIARVTDESNSTLGFGIFYWAINLGAFIFPLVLVPILKGISWNFILIAAGICTGLMIIPTIIFYKEPVKKNVTTAQKSLLHTLANAFEIIYSPFVLLYGWYVKNNTTKIVMQIFTGVLVGLGINFYLFHNSFITLFVAMLFLMSIIIISIKSSFNASEFVKNAYIYGFFFVFLGAIWALNLTLYAKILSSVIFSTVLSLKVIEIEDRAKFFDHFKFLSLIFIYSGFWVLYFQMFDSVLWYVKDYVNADSLNHAINGFLGTFGINLNWKFDIEHVTVINAMAIIMLQLIISKLVQNTKALPTMIVGIGFATLGMFLLALSANIWVFMAGIFIFSIGEMTAHPKFISYIGQIAPESRKAMYMGYIFLYGVIGSSIGSILGANLYVHYVDNLKNPQLLWIIFSCIGLATIIGLYTFNKFVKFGFRKES